MCADRAEVESGEDSPPKGRRLKLMESYGAFSDERLREVTEKIRGITARPVHQPTPPHTDAAHPSGDRIGEPIDESIGAQIGVPIDSPIEPPIGSSPLSPTVSPYGSPDGSPLERRIVLRGHKARLAKQLQQIDYQALCFVESLGGSTGAEASPYQINLPMDHLMDHRINPPMAHQTGGVQDQPICSSSVKELLLQGLILDAAFEDLNPRSLVPFLDRFGTTEELQDFLDMANACVAASKEGRAKPIQSPHGFLFAQLRVGYINPLEGYKSRRIRAQELRNRQLEEELATLRQLKEQER
jgi:hypothetical protein